MASYQPIPNADKGPKTFDIYDLNYNPEIQRYIRNKLRNRAWGETWIGSFMLGFLGATDDGVFFVIFVYLTMYILIAVGWLFFLEVDSVRIEIDTRNFTGAFAPITFVIALIMGSMIQSASEKTTGTSKLYVQLLNDIRELAIISGAIRKSIYATPDGKEYAKMGDTKANEETRENAIAHIENIRGYCMTMAKNSYKLFTFMDESDDFKVYEFSDYEIRAEHALGKARLYSEDATLTIQGSITMITDELVHMNERDIISSGIFTVAYNHLSQIMRTTLEIWKSQHIIPPAILGQVYDLILKFYLYIMVPLQVISSTNRFWALLIYPLVIICYTAPVILADWLRSPFSPNSRWEGPPLLAFRNMLYRHIEHRLGEPDKRSQQKPGKVLYRGVEHTPGVSTITF